MKRIYVITMWSGGRPAKKWKSYEQPKLLSNGTGFAFVSLDTKLPVQAIGSISVEDFESGKEDFDLAVRGTANNGPEPEPPIDFDDSNITRLH